MSAVPSTASAKLQQSYQTAINEGKVLDVSKIRTDGAGSRTMNYPKSVSGSKKWVDNLPVVSNNYNAYAFALQLLGPDFKQYADLFLQMYGAQPLERQAAAARPVAAMAPPATLGTMLVPISQVTMVTRARSPAKRGPRKAKSPRAPRVQAPLVQAMPTRGFVAPPMPQYQAPLATQYRAPLAPVARVPSPPRAVAYQAPPRVPSPPRQTFQMVGQQQMLPFRR